MTYDKNSFLAGIAVGRQLKGWGMSGAIDKSLLPSDIFIFTRPTKLNYSDGETVDYTGLVVKLKNSDGTFYTDANYPDGVIPFNELTLPAITVDLTKLPMSHFYGGGIDAVLVPVIFAQEYDSYNWYWPHQFEEKHYSVNSKPRDYGGYGSAGTQYLELLYSEPGDRLNKVEAVIMRSSGGYTYMTSYNGNVYMAAGEGEQRVDIGVMVDYEYYDPSPVWVGTLSTSWAPPADRFALRENWTTDLDVVFPLYTAYAPNLPVSTVDPNGVLLSTLTSGAGTQSIPVKWTPPESKFPGMSGVTYEKSFAINVTL